MGGGIGRARTWCTGTHTLGVVTLFQQAVYTTDWELETGLGRTGLRLALSTGFTARLSSFACGSHEVRSYPARRLAEYTPFPD